MLPTGSPRLWSPPQLPAQVQLDRGRSFVDQNRYRVGRNALVPLFAAADTLGTGSEQPFQWSSVDVVTDRDNLLKLLGWLDGRVARARHRDSGQWRIDVALAGSSTLLMRRWEELAAVNADGTGYDDNFERMCSHDSLGARKQCTLVGNDRVVAYVRGYPV